MRSALPFRERRQSLFLVILLRIILLFLCEHHSPSLFQDLLSRHLEFYRIRLAYHRSGRELTVRIEHSDETPCNKVVNRFLHIRKFTRLHTRRNNGMVVRYLRIIEHLFRFYKRFARKRSRIYGIILQSLKNLRTLGIYIVTQESSIHTRISSHLLFVKRLDELQSHVGGITKFLVTFHLERSKVEKSWRCLSSFLR